MDEAGRAIQGGARLRMLVAAALAILATLALLRVGDGEFITYDDQGDLLQNRHLQQGFTRESLAWSLTSLESSNWTPLAWMTHIADFSLYGKDPRGHHLTNLALHAVNVLLVFLVLEAMTGALWKSAFVAAVFAVHPLQVEPVAWLIQRYTLLSTLFFLLTLGAWRRYVAAPGVRRYLPILAFFALALLSKPMAVTTPFVLLLLDAWPLGRMAKPAPPSAAREKRAEKEPATRGVPIGRLLAEKLPLFALAAAVSAVTLVAQRGAETSLEVLPPGLRVANAIHAYAAYLGKFLWPRDLSVFYPYPGAGLTGASVLGAVAVLLAVTALAWRARARCPAAIVGWLWYLGTLVPVIGIVQVGLQAMADRYMYTPIIGLLIMTAWGGEALLVPRVSRVPLALAVVALVTALAGRSALQAGIWRDSVTLFAHAVRVTGPNAVAQRNLGDAFMRRGKIDEAIGRYREALRINPYSAEARYNLAEPLLARERIADAEAQYREALRLDPRMYPARYNLAVLLIRGGQLDEAEAHLREAIRLAPDLAPAHYTLGNLLARQGRFADALPEFRAAVRLRPDDRAARLRLSRVQAMLASGAKPTSPPAGSPGPAP